MSGSVRPGKRRPLAERIPTKGIVKWGKLSKVLQQLAHKAGFSVSFDGLDAQETADGIHLKALGNADAAPFELSTAGTTLTIATGTYNSVIPSPLTATISASGTEYVYLVVTYTLTANSGGYTYAATFVSAAAAVYSSAQSTPLGPSTGTYYILLGTLLDGVVSSQTVTSSLSGELRGTADSKATLIVYQA